MIAIYYRVSTDAQELDMQQHAVRVWYAKHAENKKYRTFTDKGMSGSDDNRPQFKAMLKAAQRGDFDTVVCYRLDRFSRSSTTAIRRILDLDEWGVGFVAVDQPALNLGNDVPFRKAILAIFAELAQIERETIVRRVKAGLEAAKAKGVRLGRPPTVTEDQRAEIRRLREARVSVREVAKQVGVSTATVTKTMQRAEAC